MATEKPIKGAELRRAVAEWTAMGNRVEVRPDGTLVITPAAQPVADPLDLVDFRR